MKDYLQKCKTVVFPEYTVTRFRKLDLYIAEDILRDGKMVLVDAKGQTINTNVLIVACSLNYYVVLRDDSYALYRRDGMLLTDNIRSFYVFDAGWIIISYGNGQALYRADATLAVEKIEDALVFDDGLAFLAKNFGEDWKLFKADGELVADKIVEFTLYSSAFYALKFADRPHWVVFDRDNGLETELDFPCAKIQLYGGKIFSVYGRNREFLYSARGERIDLPYLSYRVFDNGMILAETANNGHLLFDKEFNMVLLHIERIVYLEKYSSLMLVQGNFGSFIFDGCGKLICKSGTDTLRLAGHDCFLRKDVANNRWELVRSDMTVLDADCAFADVYSNGWMVLAKHRKDDATQAYFELRNAQNEVVLSDAMMIFYFPQCGAYLVNRDRRFYLYDAKGRCVVDNADCIYVYDGLYVVERENQPVEVGLLGNLMD